MGKIVAGIGSSHVPGVGRAYDMGRQETPAWKPLFDGYVPVKKWLEEEIKPDVAIMVYNDHGTAFFFDRVPTFALGIADAYPVADEGWGPRPLPEIPGAPELSSHLAESLVNDEFDITMCYDMPVDHGLLTPLPLLWSHDPDWNVKVIPLAVNVLLHPLPTGLRCFKLGQAIRRAVESYPEDTRVAIVGTGGLSHQLNGERFGFLSPEFDKEWLDRIVSDPEGLTKLSHEELMLRAGAEAVEVIMWLIMRGAMAPEVIELHRNYYAPLTTGMGLLSIVDA